MQVHLSGDHDWMAEIKSYNWFSLHRSLVGPTTEPLPGTPAVLSPPSQPQNHRLDAALAQY